jgi:hypothetical protein
MYLMTLLEKCDWLDIHPRTGRKDGTNVYKCLRLSDSAMERLSEPMGRVPRVYLTCETQFEVFEICVPV